MGIVAVAAFATTAEGPSVATSIVTCRRTSSAAAANARVVPIARRRDPEMQGWAKCSDDPGVANLGHHARHLVVKNMAVKCPATGIVGVKGDGDAAHRWHQDGIAHSTCEWGAVYRDHLESVAMKVHRVRHHRVVQHLD